MDDNRYRIVYCTPAIYSAGGTERVVIAKANYFADQLGYDVTIIVTEGGGRASFFPLSDQVKVVNLGLHFEDLWNVSFIRKASLYLQKQRRYKKLLTQELLRIRPDITISTLRREINFLNDIKDGSHKVGELHLNRANFRNFEANDSNMVKRLFANIWMENLVGKLKKLNRLVVLTEKSRESWPELTNVSVIPDPLPFDVSRRSDLSAKRVVTIGRYAYQKGYDMLLRAWSIVEKQCPDWQLAVYGMGDVATYQKQMRQLGIDTERCQLNGPVDDVVEAYLNSSVFVLSSRFEGFGLVLIEAMSCGLPVISFGCPSGPDEIITDGQNGILVPTDDVPALADRMVSLMRNADLRASLSLNARQSSVAYKIEHIARQWQLLFDELMQDGKV